MVRDPSSSQPRTDILELLKRNGAMTIDEIAGVVGLSRTAVRAHLDTLEDGGKIERARARPTGPGRPPMRFAITARGGQVFPSADAELLTDFLQFVASEDEGLIERFFRRLWSDRAREFDESLPSEMPEGELGVRRLTLERLLERTNFMPEIVQRSTSSGTEVTVRECNCPFPAAVRASRIPCRLERQFLERALEAECVGAHFARDRAGVCTFRFEIPQRQPPSGSSAE